MSAKKRTTRKIVKRRTNIERPFNGGQWTRARYFQFIRSTLRSGSSRWGPKNEALRRAATVKKINPKTGRLAQHYLCAACIIDYPRKEVSVDHIIPCGKLNSFADLPSFTKNLLCEVDGFQVLCTDCHNTKTQSEKKCQTPSS